MQNPQKNEVFTFFLDEKELNYLITFLFPDFQQEIKNLEKCIDDKIIFKKALIYGRLKQCSQIETACPGLDWHTIIKETFKESINAHKN